MKKEKSELERVKDNLTYIQYIMYTPDKIKLRIEVKTVESVSLYNCWVGGVYICVDDNYYKLYETDISDLEYTMEKVRLYLQNNFKLSDTIYIENME